MALKKIFKKIYVLHLGKDPFHSPFCWQFIWWRSSLSTRLVHCLFKSAWSQIYVMMSPALNSFPPSFSSICLVAVVSLCKIPRPCTGIPGKGHWAETVTMKVRNRNNSRILWVLWWGVEANYVDKRSALCSNKPVNMLGQCTIARSRN